LLTEALVFQDQIFYDSVSGQLESAGTAEEKLMVLIAASCPLPARGHSETDGWQIWPATWEMARHDPTLAAARARLDEAWRTQIASIVDVGIATGEFRRVDSNDFAIQLSAMLDGMAIEVILGDPTVDADRMARLAREFATLVLRPGSDP